MKIVRAILLTLNLLAAVGLLLTTLAGSIAPSRSVLPSVAAYAYLPMLALNLVFLLGWLLAGKWPFLISTAAIAARFSVLGLFFQIGGTSKVPPLEEHPDRLVLLTYNLHNFAGPEFEGKFSDSLACLFLDLVREYQPDVLCLQEYTESRTCSVTDSLQLLGYNHHIGSRNNGDRPRGTAIFSRLPITYVKAIDRQKVMVEILHAERPLRLCNVHMDSYAFTSTDHEEIAQMRRGHIDSTSTRTFRKAKQTVLRHEEEWDEQLRPIVSECTVPLIVCGDMNDIPSSWLYSRLSDHLADTYCDRGLGFSTTYHGGFPQFRIDMVFRSDHLRTLSYRRLRTRISDHYPVLVSLEPTRP
ncbi:MAG: endonuclease/exonuclease/phosphatase family protein [Bacteroidales bacterium]|nr:endonuclease/exonuclease/phosphatase family protein [Bacteroidales bacterium]